MARERRWPADRSAACSTFDLGLGRSGRDHVTDLFGHIEDLEHRRGGRHSRCRRSVRIPELSLEVQSAIAGVGTAEVRRNPDRAATRTQEPYLPLSDNSRSTGTVRALDRLIG